MSKRVILIFAGALAFVFAYSLAAESGVGEGTVYGVMRISKGKVVGTCSADIDMDNDTTFVKATLVAANRNRAYSSWQNHTDGVAPLGNAHLDGAIAGDRIVIFTGTRTLLTNFAADLTMLTVDIRDHGKPARNASDADIIDELTMPDPNSVGICDILIS
jgi:hypothetical protein